MSIVFALALFMIVVATRRKLASLGFGGVALASPKVPGAHAWTALGLAAAIACLLCLAAPNLSAIDIPLGANALPLWMVPFTGVFVWFVLSLVSNRW